MTCFYIVIINCIQSKSDQGQAWYATGRKLKESDYLEIGNDNNTREHPRVDRFLPDMQRITGKLGKLTTYLVT